MSTAELAREAGTSEPTVRRKLGRLIEDGIITIRAVSDPVALGYAVPAYRSRCRAPPDRGSGADLEQLSDDRDGGRHHRPMVKAAFRSTAITTFRDRTGLDCPVGKLTSADVPPCDTPTCNESATEERSWTT